jgi:BirA family biotin operon repressor/biotin-[acetyl-CoA-carboxylase] ligase
MYPSIIHSYNIIELQDVDSTNNFTAMNENQPYMQHKTAILATFQTKGRGQYANEWISARGKNLLLSLYIKPEKLKIEEQFLLSRITALAIRDSVSYFLKKPVHIKWPNDIYVGDKKIAGILIENSLGKNYIERSIIGIGLNVNQEVFSDLQASSFKLERNSEWELARILEYLLYRFNHYLDTMTTHKDEIHRNFDMHLYRKNEWRSYSSKKLGEFSGKIIATQANGMLIIEDHSSALHSFNHKEVEFN